jgi:hypothetical protein
MAHAIAEPSGNPELVRKPPNPSTPPMTTRVMP